MLYTAENILQLKMLTKNCFLFFSKTSKINKQGGGKYGRGKGAFIPLFRSLEHMACGKAS